MRGFLILCMAVFWASFAVAQGAPLAEDLADKSDRGLIAGLLEDALGGEGRTVRIEGFTGALSSVARIGRITIADDAGVWLSLRDIQMEWTRSALLRGRIEVDALTVAEAVLDRAPQAVPSETPTPEAQGFSLPNLPVSVDIGRVEIGRIVIGEPVLGAQAEMQLSASAQLADGSGMAVVNATRIDDQQGRFDLEASFDAGTDAVVLKLELDEAAGGLASRALNLPGTPSVRLTVAGEGPLDDLVTEIALETDGQDRLRGDVTLTGARGGGRDFEADVSGNLAPLFPDVYQAFFGDTVLLQAVGAQDGDGGLQLSRLTLRTGASRLEGAVSLSPAYWPEALNIEGVVAAPDGGTLLLPIGEAQTRVDRAALSVQYDANVSEDWTARFGIDALDAAGIKAARAELNAKGVLADAAALQSGVTANIELDVSGLGFVDAALQMAVGDHVQGRVKLDYREGEPIKLDALELSGSDYGLSGALEIAGLDADFATQVDTVLKAQDLSRFAGLAGVALVGNADASVQGTVTAGGAFDLNIEAATLGLGVGVAQADAVLAGRTDLVMSAVRDAEGTRVPQLNLRNDQLTLTAQADIVTDATTAQFDLSLPDATVIDPQLKGALRLIGGAAQAPEGWSVTADASGPFGVTATVDGRVTGEAPSVDFAARLPDIKPLVPAYSGAVEVKGRARQGPRGWSVVADASGPLGVTASVDGLVTGVAPVVDYTARLPDINPLVPAYRGAAEVSGRAAQGPDGWSIATQINGPYGVNGDVSGRVTGVNTPDLRYALRVPDIRPFAPNVRGAASVQGSAQMLPDGLKVAADLQGPHRTTGRVEGRVTGTEPLVRYTVNVPDVGPFGVPIPGALSATGTAAQQGSNWRIDARLSGLSGTNAQVSGTVGAKMGLAINGTAPLGLADPFISPRNVQGQVQIDLRVDGAPGLDAVSGTIVTRGARLSAPNFAVALEGIDARIALARGQAQIELDGAVSSGGRVSVRGPVGLTGGLQAGLTVRLENVRLVDPNLYETLLQGQISVQGPLTGGAQITGQIDVGETQVIVPSSSTSGFAIVPEIVHVNARDAVRQTIARAGFSPKSDAGGGSNGPGFGLNVVINAPSRVFVRGRGIDAEMGGRLTLRGTTNNLISAGRFSLIRGRLDVLGKRFVLDQGTVELQGQLDPFLRFSATTATSAGTATVLIEGPASSPQVSFVSSPEAPQDEVLAQIFFGRDASQLSAFQALQLASAVATLAGKGGEGVIAKLRRGFALDDLDISSDAEGNTSLKAGKYLTENVYSEVTVGDENAAGVSLNIDLTPSLTASGRVKASGDTTIGIYYGKDY